MYDKKWNHDLEKEKKVQDSERQYLSTWIGETGEANLIIVEIGKHHALPLSDYQA